MKIIALSALLAALSLSGAALADTVTSDVEHLQHGWAQIYYALPKDQKDAAFDKLEEEAELASARNPGRAEPLVWRAIIESSHAKFAGGLHALDLIKHARTLLLEAEKIDPQVLDGSVYTSLGSLYSKAPGWPLSFGDKKKAAEYLKQALAINPDGIDPNYFYGQLLVDTGNVETARKFLQKALEAPPRAGREDADAGRRAEIQSALAELH
jgi:tetratricopeptide (TPR) repeat protein